MKLLHVVILVVVGLVMGCLLIAAISLHALLGQKLGIEECLWSAILFGVAGTVGVLRGHKPWVLGWIVVGVLLVAWLGYITHHESVHTAMSHASVFVLYVGMFIDDIWPRLKKRLKKVKQSVLTVVSDAALKQQIKDAFS